MAKESKLDFVGLAHSAGSAHEERQEGRSEDRAESHSVISPGHKNLHDKKSTTTLARRLELELAPLGPGAGAFGAWSWRV